MGYRISYILANIPADDLATSLGMIIGETVPEMPDRGPWTARQNNGWSVLWSEDELFGLDNEALLRALSKRVLVLYGIINETVMASTLWAYQGGRKIWEVHWQGDEGSVPENLSFDGDLPEIFNDLRAQTDRRYQENPEEDYFMLPIDIAAHYSDFIYDSILRTEAVDAFRMLQPSGAIAKKSGFLSRLLGGKK